MDLAWPLISSTPKLTGSPLIHQRFRELWEHARPCNRHQVDKELAMQERDRHSVSKQMLATFTPLVVCEGKEVVLRERKRGFLV